MIKGTGWHDDVIKWKHFRVTGLFMREIHRSPVNCPYKGQWRGALMFSLICALNKLLCKQSWGWWFETPSRSLWRHCNVSKANEGTWYEKYTFVVYRPVIAGLRYPQGAGTPLFGSWAAEGPMGKCCCTFAGHANPNKLILVWSGLVAGAICWARAISEPDG